MKTFKVGSQLIDFNQHSIMGVLNLTPDSFYDGGEYDTIDKACKQVARMVDEGANIIDLGAFSSRPEAKLISVEEEIKRLELPFKELIKQFPEVIFSIDTYRHEVVNKLSEHGSFIVNDITGFALDNDLVSAVASLGFPYVLMHMQGTPENMQDNPQYDHIIDDLLRYFAHKIHTLKSSGIHQLIIDPGFGFGKTVKHNYTMLAKLEVFNIFEYPILVGISRKSMIYKVLNISPQEALNGTTALHMLALQNGARILRVHDVKEAVETVTLWRTLRDSVNI